MPAVVFIRCKRPCFIMQKHAFCMIKGRILRCRKHASAEWQSYMWWKVFIKTRHSSQLAVSHWTATCYTVTSCRSNSSQYSFPSPLWRVCKTTHHIIFHWQSVTYIQMWRVTSFFGKLFCAFLYLVDFKQLFPWLKLIPAKLITIIGLLCF